MYRRLGGLLRRPAKLWRQEKSPAQPGNRNPDCPVHNLSQLVSVSHTAITSVTYVTRPGLSTAIRTYCKLLCCQLLILTCIYVHKYWQVMQQGSTAMRLNCSMTMCCAVSGHAARTSPHDPEYECTTFLPNVRNGLSNDPAPYSTRPQTSATLL